MEGCGNTDTGRDGANKICRERYSHAATTSLDDDDRARIAEEAEAADIELKHTALLATDGRHPQDLDIRGKDDLEIRFAHNNILYADSWNDYFTPASLPLDDDLVVVAGRGAAAWTGVNMSFMEEHHCNDWTSDASSDTGDYGEFLTADEARLYDGNTACSNAAQLICITH